MGIKPLDKNKQQTSENSQPPQITEEMKQQSQNLNNEMKENEASKKALNSETKEVHSNPDKTESTKIIALKQKEGEQDLKQNSVDELSSSKETQVSENQNSVLNDEKDEKRPQAEEISKKLEALQEDLSASETQNIEKAPKETQVTVQNPKTVEEEPELAHIAVGKITDWFAKDNQPIDKSEEDSELIDKKEI